MRIGVISDSHDRLDYLREAISILKSENISTLIHLGDYVSPFTIPLLDLDNVMGIFGNNDGDKLLLQKKANENGIKLQRGPAFIELDGRKIAFMHEPYEIEAFRKSNLYDIILYGHTHEKSIIENPLTINPGELCGWLTNTGTFAIIDLEKLSSEFITI
jgi:putative phosphoesterase